MNWKSKFILIVLVFIFILSFPAVPTFAGPPVVLYIDADEIIGGPGTFEAYGPAVSSGIMCPTGTTLDLDVVTSGPQNGNFRILKVSKQFTCDDGSGTFEVKMVVKLDLTTHHTTANWKLVGGTGNYVGLNGNGKLVGIPIVPGTSITDYYDGKIH